MSLDPTGDEVKAVRAGLGMSVMAFARLLGVAEETVHRWERRGSARTRMEMPAGRVVHIAEGLLARLGEEDRALLRRRLSQGPWCWTGRFDLLPLYTLLRWVFGDEGPSVWRSGVAGNEGNGA